MDGREVIGLDGKPVNYTRNGDGTITWSSNATEDIKKIGGAMLSTEFGEKQFNWLQNSKTKFTLTYNATKLFKKGYGQRKMSGKTNEDGSPVSGEIIIYEKSILNIDEKDGNNRFDKTANDESIGAVSVHERFHFEQDQKKLDDDYEDELDQPANQNLPINSEYNFRKEYRQKNGGDVNRLKVYEDNGYYGLDENNKPVEPNGN
jgi:hypothetical protein